MSTLYEIVFYGKLAAGFNEETTKQHVAQLFKTTVDQVERMFTGKRVVIRNKLDYDTAKKYILAMQKRGAECQIEEMGVPGIVVNDAPTASVSAPTPTPTPTPTPKPKPQASNFGSAGDSQEVASKSGLKLAGEKADEILANIHLNVDPAGIRLSEEKIVEAPDLPGVDDLSVAPAGVDLSDKKDDLPVSVPDTSHLTIE